ncbi:methyl-accepting chemotaxis protein [Paenibacillus sp. MZ04-78.2]|uniref:HAMP domain-containing methyl-accepting chemotaxis protein n=1 Tax=Paenibacillus sp. MZ04-78.2 TaxID=2962034 RepID=UPI0020B784D7|nr:HAMP domain-containing methyl-accepting chemotaxis protein [Paenibacillus sp. MZ04-78.2]MCP3773065.1 methyl-accepting chemotaxis protein [Paenibacillus sp. MZ04-78.2]
MMGKHRFMLSVGRKLFLSFLLLILLLAGLGLTSLGRGAKMQSKTEEISSIWLSGVGIANNVNYLTEHVLVLQYEILSNPDVSQKQQYTQEAATTFAEIDKQLNSYGDPYANDEDRINTEQLRAKWNSYKEVFDRTLALGKQIDLVRGAGKQEKELTALMVQSQQIYDEMQKLLNKMIKINNDGAKKSTQESRQIYQSNIGLTTGMIAISVVIGIALVIVMIRIISRPVKLVSETLHRVSGGDLTVEPLAVKQKDEIGSLVVSLNEMVSQLKMNVIQIQEASTTVAASSEELQASSEQNTTATKTVTLSIQEMASGAESQLMRSDETGRAMEEMAAGIQRIAETTSDVSELSQESAIQAQHGNDAIQAARSRMNALSESVGHASADIQTLETHSVNVGSILQIINDIASQTGLLALNASIEAARAGEHGQGFAVVANEVKKLAQQSGEAVQSISDIITQIQTDTSKAVLTMNRSLSEVRVGLQAVTEADDAFQQITRTANDVSGKIQEVAAAVQEMAAGSEQVSASASEMSQIARHAAESTQTIAATTEEQLASAEEIASSAESLSRTAQDLSELVNRFKL